MRVPELRVEKRARGDHHMDTGHVDVGFHEEHMEGLAFHSPSAFTPYHAVRR